MDATEEVEAYTSAAAQQYLEQIDRTFVEHLSRLLPEDSGTFAVLDVGCGPGQIPIMIGQRWPTASVTGIDAAPHMVEQAKHDAQRAGVSNVRFEVFRVAQDAASTRLPRARARPISTYTCSASTSSTWTRAPTRI